MPAPIVYHGNLLQSGTIFQMGQAAQNETPFLVDPDNPYTRQYDGSSLLSYSASGVVYITIIRYSTVIVSLPTSGHDPDAVFLLSRGWESGLGYSTTFAVASSSDGDAPGYGLVTKSWTGEDVPSLYVADVSDAARHPELKNYYFSITALSSWQIPEIYEVGFTKKWTMPRAPLVGVQRGLARQTTRLEIPNGSPFTKRDGPIVRETTYNAVLISGSEVEAFHWFISDTDGGQIFPFTDDLGATYLAELVNQDVVESDTAGVYSASLTFREVKIERN